MKNYRTLTSIIKINDYQKVTDYIDLYNNKTNSQLSISKFIWEAVKHYINYLRNNKGIK